MAFFSCGDVAALAITKPLVELGYPAHEAYQVAGMAVMLRWPGLYELEIFSDPELPDSLWNEDPRVLAARGVEAVRGVLSTASA